MGQHGQTANYRYALLGVVGVVAFVAIIAILRSGSPLSFDSDHGTLVGNAVSNVVDQAPIIATKTINSGQVVGVRLGDVDHEVSNLIIDDSGIAVFSIDGEVAPSIREGETAIFTHKTLRLDSINRKTIVPPCAPGGSSCPSPFTIVSAEVTITVYPDGIGAPRADNAPPPHVLAIRLSLGDEINYVFHDLDHTILFSGINSEATPYLSLYLDGQEMPLRFQGDSDLFFGNQIIRVNEVLVVRDTGVAMVELWFYDRRYDDSCVGTGSNVNIPLDAICCNGMVTQVPTCPDGAALDCAGRRLYCDGSSLRSKAVATPTAGGPFIGGNTAFNIYYQNGAPPDVVYDGGKFPFSANIVVENVGESDIGPDTVNPYATMRLEGISPESFDTTAAELQTTITERIDGMKKDDDGTLLPGQIANVVFPGLNFQGVLQGDQQVTLRGTFCHDYRTSATANICFSGADCENGEKAVYTSAGPIIVSDVTQSKSTMTTRMVSFSISHAGYGAVFARTPGENCDADINNPNKDLLAVSVNAENTVARCERFGGHASGAVTLFGGAPQTIVCEFEWQGTQPSNSEVPIMITIDYRYGEYIEQPITIRHVETGDDYLPGDLIPPVNCNDATKSGSVADWEIVSRWLVANGLSDTSGVTCGADGRVASITYTNKGISSFPTDTSNVACLNCLPKLELLQLCNNNLVGEFPSVSGMSKLRQLSLCANKLSGPIPSMNGLTSLRWLDLMSNDYSGSAPDLSGLPILASLYLNGNEFSGAYPSMPSSLTYANLQYNRFCGSPPPLPSGVVASNWRMTPQDQSACGGSS